MHSRTTAVAAVLAGLLLPAAASAAPRAVTVSEAAPTATWEGAGAPAANISFYEGDTTGQAACGSSPTDHCDDTLVHFTGAGPYDDSGLTFTIDGYDHADYDLRVYSSDATGAEGDYLGNPTGDGAGPLGAVLPTFLGDGESFSTFADPDTYYLVRVVYFTTAGDEGYTGTVSWAGTAATPEDEGAPEAS